MKRSTIALIIGLTLAGVIGMAVLIFAGGYFLVHGISSKPSTDAERKLVVDAARIAKFGTSIDPQCGKFTTRINIDGTRDIEYECDDEGITVLAGAEINPSVRDARQSFVLAIGAFKAGIAIGDGALRPRNDLTSLGDQTYAANLTKGSDDVVGNVFVVRQGRIVHTLLLTGVSFETAEVARELLEPVLEEGRRQYAKPHARGGGEGASGARALRMHAGTRFASRARAKEKL